MNCVGIVLDEKNWMRQMALPMELERLQEKYKICEEESLIFNAEFRMRRKWVKCTGEDFESDWDSKWLQFEGFFKAIPQEKRFIGCHSGDMSLDHALGGNRLSARLLTENFKRAFRFCNRISADYFCFSICSDPIFFGPKRDTLISRISPVLEELGNYYRQNNFTFQICFENHSLLKFPSLVHEMSQVLDVFRNYFPNTKINLNLGKFFKTWYLINEREDLYGNIIHDFFYFEKYFITVLEYILQYSFNISEEIYLFYLSGTSEESSRNLCGCDLSYSTEDIVTDNGRIPFFAILKLLNYLKMSDSQNVLRVMLDPVGYPEYELIDLREMVYSYLDMIIS